VSQICNGIECIKHIDINRLMNATTKPQKAMSIYIMKIENIIKMFKDI